MGLDNPLVLSFTPFATDDDSIERAIFAQVELLVDVIKIGLKFTPVGVVGAPIPIFVNLWDGKLVDRDGTIDASSWIAVL